MSYSNGQAPNNEEAQENEITQEIPTSSSPHGQNHAGNSSTFKPKTKRISHLTRLLTILLIIILAGSVGIYSLARYGFLPASIHVGKVSVVLPGSADATAQQFMNSMIHKNWQAMWGMLYPDEQRQWTGEQDFIRFEQTKFGKLNLQSFTNTPSAMQGSWHDPHSSHVYSNVATLNSTMQASSPEGFLTPASSYALQHGLFTNTNFALKLYNGSWKVVVAGPADQDAPILIPSTVPAVKLTVPILMYHHVSNREISSVDRLEAGLTVKASDFDSQLAYLQQQGYHSINEVELFDALYYGKALPAHSVILSFDDGYEDMYTDALPILLKHGDRGVFNVITGMSGRSYMTWDQIKTLESDGMEIESHSVHHVNVGNPPKGTSTHVELSQSKQTLESELKHPVQFFCYPSGEPFHHGSQIQRQKVLHELASDGYAGALLDPFAANTALQSSQAPYQLNRIRVNGGETLQAFEQNVSANIKSHIHTNLTGW